MIKFKIKTNNKYADAFLVGVSVVFAFFVLAPLFTYLLSLCLYKLHIMNYVADYWECFWSGIFLILIKEFFKEGK